MKMVDTGQKIVCNKQWCIVMEIVHEFYLDYADIHFWHK